jgi:hypothetical protein
MSTVPSLDVVRLCRDCAHLRRETSRILFFTVYGSWMFSKCAAFPDVVSGEAGKFCDIEREFGTKCGPEGKLWQPSVP